MASNTNKTETIRARKVKNSGRQRKNRLASIGTTKTQDDLFKVKKD